MKYGKFLDRYGSDYSIKTKIKLACVLSWCLDVFSHKLKCFPAHFQPSSNKSMPGGICSTSKL